MNRITSNENDSQKGGGVKVQGFDPQRPIIVISVHNRELKTFFWEVFHGWTPTKTDPLEGGHR